MDYEEILFGLKEVLEADKALDIKVEEEGCLGSYVSVLDRLAVHLRSQSNRDIVRESGLLGKLFRSLGVILDGAFHGGENKAELFQLGSEVIRCIANCFIDNDKNRKLFIEPHSTKRNEILDYHVGLILKLESADRCISGLQMRTIVMVRNLCFESEEYRSRCVEPVVGPLILFLKRHSQDYLEEEFSSAVVLGLQFLCDIMGVFYSQFDIENIMFFATLLRRAAATLESSNTRDSSAEEEQQQQQQQEEEEEEPCNEIVICLTQIIETCLDKNSKLDFSDLCRNSKLQRTLLETLDILYEKTFINKLIVMRSITSSIGYVSASKINSNKQDRPMCYELLNSSKNGYVISAALFVLSNSISERNDVEEILRHTSLAQFVNCTVYFKDPIQYQSFLDIFKKCLNLSTVSTFPVSDHSRLFNLLKLCHDQCRYYPSVSPILEGLLNKILVTFTGSSLLAATLLQDMVAEIGGVPACLMLDKISKQRDNASEDTFSKLFDAIFRFNDVTTSNEGTSIQYLFHMTKSIGMYLHDCSPNGSNLLLTKYTDSLLLLFKSIISLQDKNDPGSKSVWNNAKFDAGMILKLNKNATEPPSPQLSELLHTCRSLF
ncbi:Bem4p Ecym_2387 [Eremothecium cymbalariae DBVPG|uniref:UNC-45/Cro1/She4 central domain-containing protein n=1 Tax=Eremothecium cymbalariae (strain CBS 270.75 / DBVPG 7215 / KCTC 17166 / NRRL Y-17582) TaxID=931890 RepID=G8JNQ2_ERECY|nr:Hypothetical protein Ecym_2387 [Eremothecium cymbalariae DBVPG\